MNVAIATAIMWFGNILVICLFVRAILSWFPGGRRSFIYNALSVITEPFVSPVRKLIQKSPLGGGVLDFSFIIVLVLIRLLTPVLSNWALRLPF
jgi:YggT family protein